jgi:hypothetical protein
MTPIHTTSFAHAYTMFRGTQQKPCATVRFMYCGLIAGCQWRWPSCHGRTGAADQGGSRREDASHHEHLPLPGIPTTSSVPPIESAWLLAYSSTVWCSGHNNVAAHVHVSTGLASSVLDARSARGPLHVASANSQCDP